MKKILPPTYFWVCILLAVILHIVLPLARVVPLPYGYLGLIPIVIGVYLNLAADKLFQRYQTTVKPFEKPTGLILAGPFMICRHPMYLGMVLILLGLGFALGSLAGFVPLLVFFAIMQIVFIPPEERAMEEEFGEEYGEYKSKVRKWL